MPPNLSHKNINLQAISKKIFCYQHSDFKILNSNLLNKFNKFYDHIDTRKTHLFEGRYENIYIKSELIEELNTVLELSLHCVQKITGSLYPKSGLWFNYMQPGHITLPHAHDDNDEVYSAVYYIQVPDNSGDLIIMDDQQHTISPIEGMLVLFPPNLVHNVTKNNSTENRLSLGINIGN